MFLKQLDTQLGERRREKFRLALLYENIVGYIYIVAALFFYFFNKFKMRFKMQIGNSELKTARGEVMGIGRVKFTKTSWFNYEIPLLSFIVIKKIDGTFVSTCIHFRIDGYGDTAENAQSDMADNIWYFLSENFNNKKCKGKCWLNMYELSKGDEISTILWDKYHAVQFMLAERGITMDKYMQLQEKIAELESNVKKLEEKIKKSSADKRREFMYKFMSNTESSTASEYLNIHLLRRRQRNNVLYR
jgi:hypothetical protein